MTLPSQSGLRNDDVHRRRHKRATAFTAVLCLVLDGGRMTITRRGLHEENARLEAIIDAANEQKAANFKAYREQLEKAGHDKAHVKSEIEAFKKAERKLRALIKNADAVIEQEDLVEEIIDEIQKPVGINPALRVTRIAHTSASNNSPQSTATPSEIKEPAPEVPPCLAAVEPAKSLTVPAPASAGSLISNARPEAEDVLEFLRRNSDNTVREEVRS